MLAPISRKRNFPWPWRRLRRSFSPSRLSHNDYLNDYTSAATFIATNSRRYYPTVTPLSVKGECTSATARRAGETQPRLEKVFFPFLPARGDFSRGCPRSTSREDSLRPPWDGMAKENGWKAGSTVKAARPEITGNRRKITQSQCVVQENPRYELFSEDLISELIMN